MTAQFIYINLKTLSILFYYFCPNLKIKMKKINIVAEKDMVFLRIPQHIGVLFNQKFSY